MEDEGGEEDEEEEAENEEEEERAARARGAAPSSTRPVGAETGRQDKVPPPLLLNLALCRPSLILARK